MNAALHDFPKTDESYAIQTTRYSTTIREFINAIDGQIEIRMDRLRFPPPNIDEYLETYCTNRWLINDPFFDPRR
jgi:hypothetical protein